jgi:hypothetical protein
MRGRGAKNAWAKCVHSGTNCSFLILPCYKLNNVKFWKRSKGPERTADNLTAICEPIVLDQRFPAFFLSRTP